MRFVYALLFALPVCTVTLGQNAQLGELRLLGYTATGAYGQDGNKVYTRPSLEADWRYIFTLAGRADEGQASLVNKDTLLYSRSDDSLFYYNLNGKLLGSAAKDEMIKRFCNAGIISIAFRKGSNGCFHSYEDRITYEYTAEDFSNVYESSSGSRHKSRLPAYRLQVSEEHVRNLVKIIPALFKPLAGATIKQLGFTSAHYEQCKKEIRILATSKASNKQSIPGLESYYIRDDQRPDFERLYRLADAVGHLEDSVLNNFLLYGDVIISTTSNYIAIDLINSDNQVLTMIRRFAEPSAFYLPWTIRLNGYSWQTNSMQINNFIKTVYPRLLDDVSKTAAIHELISYLYFSTNIGK